MLWQRVLTALVLLPPAVAAILYLPLRWLAPLFAAIGLLGAAEWVTLAGIRERRRRLSYLLVLLLLLLPVALLRVAPGVQTAVLAASALWWLLALRWILRYPHGFSADSPSVAVRALLGCLVLPATVMGLIAVRASSLGTYGLLTLFLLVWGADTGAYFAGRAFGRHKLAPAVSPGKTWEGFAGGLLTALAAGAAVAYGLKLQVPMAGWLLLCALVASVSVVGDLTESLLKRQVGVKDSGKLLPGHGGVLDRIDSLLAAAPVMALGLGVLGL